MIIRFILGFIFILLALVGASLLFGVVSIDKALPQFSGEVMLAGLQHPLIISRDSFAIPHIEAETDEDAYFGLGFVHAQERLPQMDLSRRIGRGMLSAIVGEKALLLDKWAHTIGFARIAEEMWKSCSPQTQKFLTAYSKGINAYIANADGKYGFEFDALHYKPALWKPQDCLIIGRLMSWEMNFSYWTDAAFGDIALKLDAEHLHALMPEYDGPTVLEGNTASRPVFFSTLKIDSTKKDSLVKRDSVPQNSPLHSSIHSPEEYDLAGLLGINPGSGGGSNAFAVSPKRTASGGAMLENDMHLAVASPARFYLAHIRSKEGLNLAGFCVPGLPIFISGRNENLSWGVTNGSIDESDYFILTPDSTGYRTPSGTKYFTTITENIVVKTDDPEQPRKIIPFSIRVSDHGPIVNDLPTFELAKIFANTPKMSVLSQSETVLGKNHIVALQWNGSKVTGDEIGAFFAFHKASSATDHSIMNDFATPCLNLCLADRKGNISYQLIGRIPRRSGSEERVLLPRNADVPDDLWMDDVLTSSLPSVSNPEEGFIISANNPSTSHRTFPHSNNWEPSSRAERLRQLLAFYPKFDLAHVRQVMTDVTSPYEKNVLAGNILRVMRTKQNDTVMKYDRTTEVALQYLENWDGRQSEIDVATTICNVFLNRLCIDAIEDDLGADLFHEFMYINNVPIRTVSNMLRDENNILWDDVRSPQKESRDTIIRWSFLRTVQHLTKILGSDVRGWNWGKLHSLTYRHPFSAASDVVASKSNVASGYAGGGSTSVAQASYSFWKPYEQRVGPSMRMFADMKTNILYAILPTGNSGNMFSSHYGDMAKIFKQGQMIPLSLTTQNKPMKTLRLIPKE